MNAAVEALPSVGRSHVVQESSRRRMPGTARITEGESIVRTSLDPIAIVDGVVGGSDMRSQVQVWVRGTGPYAILDGSLSPSGFKIASSEDSSVEVNYTSDAIASANAMVAPNEEAGSWQMSAGGSKWYVTLLSHVSNV